MNYGCTVRLEAIPRRYNGLKNSLREALQVRLPRVALVLEVNESLAPFFVLVGVMAAPLSPKISPFKSACVCARLLLARLRGLLVAHWGMIDLLPENHLTNRWKHCGSKRAKTAAQT